MGRGRPLGPRDLIPLVAFLLLAGLAWSSRGHWLPVLAPELLQPSDGGQRGSGAPAAGDGRTAADSAGDRASADGPATPGGTTPRAAADRDRATGPGSPGVGDAALVVAPGGLPGADPPSSAKAAALAPGDSTRADPRLSGPGAARAAGDPAPTGDDGLPANGPGADGLPLGTSADAAGHTPSAEPTAPDGVDPSDGAGTLERRWVPGSRSDPLEQAFAAAPHDPAALAPLLASLLEARRPGLALERVVTHGEEGGDPAQVEQLLARHDPHREDKLAVLLGAARAHLDGARALTEREHWRAAWSLADGARALLIGARQECGPTLTAERAAGLDHELASWRDGLLRRREVRAVLTAAGAPLPVDADASLQAARDVRQDARAAEQGDPVQQSTTRHFQVHTARGSRITRQAGEVLEAAYDLARRELDADPLRSGPHLRVEVLDDEHGWSRRLGLLEPAPPAGSDAFREPDGTLVLRDPHLDGGDTARLWQVLGREARRLVVEARLGAERRHGWLATGLAAQGEGTRRLADGRVQLEPLPSALRDRALASLRGWGASRPPIESVLALGARAGDGPLWCWALVHFLRTEGSWDDPLESLLEAGAGTDGALLLRTTVLTDPAVTRTGLEDTRDLEAALAAWLERQLALEQGEPAALAIELERLEAALQARAVERAERLRARLAEVAPDHERVLALGARLARLRNDRDLALLRARWLAAVRPADAPAGQRFAEVADLHGPSATALRFAESSLRGPLLDLADTLLAEGDGLSALRLVDRGLAAAPLDRALRDRRTALLDALDPGAGTVWRRPAALDDLSGLHGERELWAAGAQGLQVTVGDRAEPTTLRGLLELRPPCRVSARLILRDVPGSTTREDDQASLGLLLGGDEPLDHGAWGVIVSRSGRVQLARRGGLEWPGVTLGRGRRGLVELSLDLGERQLSLAVDGRPPMVLPRGSRPVEGWLALRAWRVDGAVQQLVVERTREPDLSAAWAVRAR